MPIRSCLPLLPFAFAGALAAQAPAITPAGDPSIRPDTIYALAVDSAKYRGQDDVLLLDDGVIRIEPDGHRTTTYHQVIQILTEDAVQPHQEYSFSYSPGHEKFTIDWIRVVKPDGTVISAAPAQRQETDVPAQMGDPVYSDRKVIRVSLSGVAPGTLVDYAITTEELKPWLPGDFLLNWRISAGTSVLRSRYIVDVPAGMHPRIKEWNLSFPHRTATRKGREVFTWAAQNVEWIKPESFAADSNNVTMHLAVGSPQTWADIGKWYAGLARGRADATPILTAKVHDLVANARTLDDSIRAVHRWVTQDIRYVSIALGIGGYQPRLPDTVITTGFGDCKDKATLFVAAMGVLGLKAYPVLLSSTGGVERDLPALNQFDHAIAVVERPAGRVFTDLTTGIVPFGELPLVEQGEFGLLVHPAGTVEEVTFPKDSIEVNRQSIHLTGTIGSDGLFRGRYDETATGASAPRLRDAFSTPYDSTQRADVSRRMATGLFTGARGDSLQLFNGKDLAAPAHISLAVLGGKAVLRSGDTHILPGLLGSMASLGDLATKIEGEGPRRYPIDAEEVIGASVVDRTIELTLPAGVRPRLPTGITANSPFGDYRSEYSFDGGVLRMRRVMSGKRGVLPASRIDELTAWLRAVAKDDVEFIALEGWPAAN
ncbi:MAG: DUF3857 domain-containing transglutaminase family protein [Gemmatimonadales bacterium]